MRDLNGKETQAKFYMYDKLVTTQVGTGYFEKPMNLVAWGWLYKDIDYGHVFHDHFFHSSHFHNNHLHNNHYHVFIIDFIDLFVFFELIFFINPNISLENIIRYHNIFSWYVNKLLFIPL
ncbi:glycoside hydrolase family 16 [Colletotrichum truncatum]|uniref:Glycoside hydrolase family 16 n=1 Tax=Colletotrichum truncatum TaxID=5467 RepID=A0ACC3YQ29_COLTU